MKNLLIVSTLFFSAIFSSASHAEWTEVSADVDGITYYVDFERIRKHDGLVYHWDLVDFPKSFEYENLSYLSYKSYNECDCDRFRYKILTVIIYTQPMGQGVSDSISWKDQEWVYPSDSLGKAILKAVCAHVE